MDHKPVSYETNGRSFEIRTMPTAPGYVIAGFENGERVTFSYGVDYGVGYDFEIYTGQNAVAAVIEVVKGELDRRAK